VEQLTQTRDGDKRAEMEETPEHSSERVWRRGGGTPSDTLKGHKRGRLDTCGLGRKEKTLAERKGGQRKGAHLPTSIKCETKETKRGCGEGGGGAIESRRGS